VCIATDLGQINRLNQIIRNLQVFYGGYRVKTNNNKLGFMDITKFRTILLFLKG